MTVHWWMLLVLTGCGSQFGLKDPDALFFDADEDGYTGTEDCDEYDATVNSGASESCDGIDNDCDGRTDESGQLYYGDADADGFGTPDVSVDSCEAPTGYVADNTDCDDDVATIYPGADETCDDVDEDCDALVDEDAVDGETFYADADADGFGDEDGALVSCEMPDGYVTDDSDCDDARDDVNPASPEVCDGEADEDCDETVDEDDAEGTEVFYADGDGDGYGVSEDTTEACEAPSGYAALDGDCDDGELAVNPGATEVCNDIDDDCDGALDDADADLDITTASIWYADADGDGFGDADEDAVSCEPPSGYVDDDADCDDDEDAVNPDAVEVCNAIDDDCDGLIDDADTGLDLSTADTFYADDDADGFGDADDTTSACEAPSGYVDDDADCDDAEEDINPDADEICDEGIDNDCNGLADDEDTGVDLSTGEEGYVDADGDGFGDADMVVQACVLGSGVVSDDSDCDDASSAVNPSAEEVCNGVDDDCDGDVDDDDADVDTGTWSTWYADVDEDGYGDADEVELSCDAPDGYVADATDCDDDEADYYPGADEACDGEDGDCDGNVDEGLDGLFEDCAAASCDAILTSDSSATDGDYWIDFDGTATETECDMTTDGGGWTLIFADDFEGGADADWSRSDTFSCDGDDFFGRYDGSKESDIDLDTYAITHTEAWVVLDYWALDSWDNEDAFVEVDGSEIWSETPAWWTSSYNYVCGNGFWPDEDYAISEFVSHSASTLTLNAGSDLDESKGNESWALNDVEVWIR